LSDENKEVVEKYGVWKEKNNYGKIYMGVERTTFVLDENLVIKKIFRKVKVDGHNEEIKHSLAS
jgi:peroxiredoxin Q/BCP